MSYTYEQQKVIISSLIDKVNKLELRIKELEGCKQPNIISLESVGQSIASNQKKDKPKSVEKRLITIYSVYKQIFDSNDFDLHNFNIHSSKVCNWLKKQFDIKTEGDHSQQKKVCRWLFIIIGMLKYYNISNKDYNELSIVYKQFCKDNAYQVSINKRKPGLSWKVMLDNYEKDKKLVSKLLNTPFDKIKKTMRLHKSSRCRKYDVIKKILFIGFYFELEAPLRSEIFYKLKVMNKNTIIDDKFNYIDINERLLYIHRYKSEHNKTWTNIKYEIPKPFAELLSKWVLLQKEFYPNTDYLFVDSKGNEYSDNSISQYIKDTFGYGNNDLRNYFVADYVIKLEPSEKNRYAKLMLHSPMTQAFIYSKYSEN